MLFIKEYLQKHIEQKEVKRVSRQYILADGLTVTVDDYSAIGNDDTFYNKYGYDTELRRGTACIQANGREQWLFGLPKFGYDTEEIGQSKEGGTIWYFTEKENGECGHVAFLDEEHIIVGSKNVHIVLGLNAYEKDLEMYQALAETRLEYALRIATLLKHQGWNASLREYMVRERIVMVFEALFNNHIVYYDNETYRVTAFVQDGIVLSPILTTRMCSMYQLPIVNIVVASTEEEYKQCCQLFTCCERDSEGAVIYKEAMGRVRLFKLKHPVYVAKRAARELIKRRASKQQWTDRMQQLHVDADEQLLLELYKFYLWLLHNIPDYSAEEIQNRFAIMWKEFQDLGCPSLPDIVKDDRNTTVHVIGFVGIPGSGKSTLSKALERCLLKKGLSVVRVNQDELCKNRKQFVSRLQQLSKTQNGGYILVDKVNHTSHLRKDIELLFVNVSWVVFECGNDDMIQVCMERIRDRGIYHPSLVYSYKTREVLTRFHSELQPPCGDNVHTINMHDSVLDQLRHLSSCVKVGVDPAFVELSVKKGVSAVPTILYWKIDLPNGKHVTLVYQPTKEDTEALLPHFGDEVDVDVEYILNTERVRVASVMKTPFLEKYCKNVYPHITLWTAEGVKPFEANAAFTSPSAVKECVASNESIFKGIITVEIK